MEDPGKMAILEANSTFCHSFIFLAWSPICASKPSMLTRPVASQPSGVIWPGKLPSKMKRTRCIYFWWPHVNSLAASDKPFHNNGTKFQEKNQTMSVCGFNMVVIFMKHWQHRGMLFLVFNSTLAHHGFECVCGAAWTPIFLGLKETYGRTVDWNLPRVCLSSMRSVQILHLIIAKGSALKILYALPHWHAGKKSVLEGTILQPRAQRFFSHEMAKTPF